MESREMTRSAFLRVCAGAGIGLAGLGLGRPRRATAAPPTIHDIRATAGPSSAIEPSSGQHKFLRATQNPAHGTTFQFTLPVLAMNATTVETVTRSELGARGERPTHSG